MYFKILVGSKSCHGGTYKWDLPVGDIPGAWSKRINGKLIPCRNGYHIAEDWQLFEWMDSSIQEIYIAEKKYKSIKATDKVVARSIRLVKKVDITHEQAKSIALEVFEFLQDDRFKFYRIREDYKSVEYSKRLSKYYLCRFLRFARLCGTTWEDQAMIKKRVFEIFCKHLDLTN